MPSFFNPVQGQDFEQRRRMAEIMMRQGASTPSNTAGGALSKILLAYTGGKALKSAGEEEKEFKKSQQEALVQALASQDPTFQGLSQQLAGTHPELATSFAMRGLEQKMKAGQRREPIKVGDQLVDPDTFEVLFQGRDKPGEFEKKLSLAGFDPGSQEAQQFARKQMMKSGVNVNLPGATPPPPTREQVFREDQLERAKGARASNAEIIKLGSESARAIPKLERGLDLLNEVGTGTGEATLLSLKKAVSALGYDVNMDKIASAEELQTIMGDQVMARVAQTKGAVSEKEMALFTEYSANFGKTPEGNRRILRFALATEQRNAEKADLVRSLRREGATSLEIQDSVDQFMAENDLSTMLATEQPVMPASVSPQQSSPPGLGAAAGPSIDDILNQYAPIQ